MEITYKIYFDDKPFILTNRLSPQLEQLKAVPSTLFIAEPGETAVSDAIEAIETPEVAAVILYHGHIGDLWTLFQDAFTPITAGGGLVKNSGGEFLFMYRRNKWDLPKGKLDDGETIEACALREVAEETGLHQVRLDRHLCTTWHTYRQHGRYYLKQSVWFLMSALADEPTVPQTEEDITALQWLKPEQWASIYNNTFPSIKDVLGTYVSEALR